MFYIEGGGRKFYLVRTGQTDRQTDRQTHTQTHRSTYRGGAHLKMRQEKDQLSKALTSENDLVKDKMNSEIEEKKRQQQGLESILKKNEAIGSEMIPTTVRHLPIL